MLNYFVILNVSENAEPEVIKASYKALAKKYHPDNISLSKEDAEKHMALINEAYQVLSDEKTKIEYIKKLHAERKDNCNFEYKPMEENIYYDSNSYDSDKPTLFNWIISVLVIISILCCIIYFAPDALKNILYDIQIEFEEVINTFK